MSISPARVQVIHNSADAAAQTVDVWLNDALLIDNFQYRTASPFIDAPQGVNFDITIQPSNSTDTINGLARFTYNLTGGNKYILVATGIVIPTGYNPATPFNIYVYDMAREAATAASNTDVIVFHGSSDAPVVDVVEVGAGAGTIVDNLGYGQFTGYLELPTADYVLQVRDETGTVAVASYDAPLADLGLDGKALAVVASGFLNPIVNNNGPSFGLFVALPSGGDLIPLLNVTGIKESNFDEASLRVYPNPARDRVNLQFNLKKAGNVDLQIRTLSGTLVQRQSLGMMQANESLTTLNVGDLSAGLYLITLKSGDSQVTVKLNKVNY
jgi:hypothetical protein